MTTTADGATTSSLPAPARWVDLPPDLLRDVSGRLHDAAEFTRFHAVCKPWRSALTSSPATLFPWLVAPRDDCSALKFIRCVFSNASYRAAAPVRFGKHGGWVARADGAAAWLFAALPEPSLVHPLTGSASPLPFFPDDDDGIKGVMENSRGVIYDDGTTFLYNLSGLDYLDDDEEDAAMHALRVTLVFRAAILFSGHTEWRFVESTMDARTPIGHYLAAYQDGNILLSVDSNIHDHVLELSDTGTSDLQVDKYQTRRMPDGEVDITYRQVSTHILESRGELLRVSVLVRRERDGKLRGQGAAGHARALAMSVHALETVQDVGGGRTVKWAKRDGRSLTDRVLFLGFPTSFSVDAARFHGAEDDVVGGCAYFFHSWCVRAGAAKSPCRLFRYSLVDHKAKFMEHLPPRPKERCVWLLPQPKIAPIEVIRERLKTRDVDYPARRSTIRMERRPKHSEPSSFRVVVVVRNLPPSVDSSRVSRFFGKHGKVAAARVTSPGAARVTMVTANKPDDAEAALDGLVMDGFTLVVSRVRKKQSGRGNALG